MDERLFMRCEQHRGESIAKLNELFAKRTQLKEELEEVEVQIQVGRGDMFGVEWVQNQIREIGKEDKLQEVKKEKEAGILSKVTPSDIEFLASRVAEKLKPKEATGA